MKNAIFTIVAKNYFSSAITLGKSVKRCVPDCDFIVILCDENDGEIELQDYEFEVVIANKMGIPGFEKMSFLYDVVELATSIKPFTFLYLMEEKGYKLGLNYKDCGQIIFKRRQNVLMGGSGCGCSASVLNSFILKKMNEGVYKKVIFMATGALLSTTSCQQGDTVPGIAHAIVIEGDSEDE